MQKKKMQKFFEAKFFQNIFAKTNFIEIFTYQIYFFINSSTNNSRAQATLKGIKLTLYTLYQS